MEVSDSEAELMILAQQHDLMPDGGSDPMHLRGE